jgi:hypothetical protein
MTNGPFPHFGQSLIPVGLSNVVAISSGEIHSLALESDGTVAAWGNNSFGQTNVPTGLNAIAIAAGSFHNLALTTNGTVVAWGNNYYGQTNVPPGLSNVIAIAADSSHSLAVKNDGTVIVWGDNTYGQTNVPSDLKNVVAVVGKDGRGMAITINLSITSIQQKGNDIWLQFRGFSGQDYTAEYSSDLIHWNPVPDGEIEGNGEDALVMDSQATLTSPIKFYRVRQSPIQ